MTAADPAPLLAAIDTGSPVTSVALARGEETLATRSERGRLASERVLAMLDAVCREVGVAPHDLEGLIALRGPGGFTGLRVGLATALGVHQAVGVPATALPTLQVLAASVEAAAGSVRAAVDAMRGEWTVQDFTLRAGRPEPLAEPRLVPVGDLSSDAPAVLVGFALPPPATERTGAALDIREAPPLAPIAARLAARHPPAWDATLLTRPLYARPPAVHT